MKEMVFFGAGAVAAIGLPTNKEFAAHIASELGRNRPASQHQILNALGDEARNPETLIPLTEDDTKETSVESARQKLKVALKLQSNEALSDSVGQALLNTLKITYYNGLNYFQPLINKAIDSGIENFCIATTNYDTSIESYCDQHNIGCSILAMHLVELLIDLPKHVRLIKLRGSINWFVESHSERVFYVGEQDNKLWKRSSKLTRVMSTDKPTDSRVYSLLSAERNDFTKRLDESDVLTIVGCSLSDESQMVKFLAWSKAKGGRVVRIIDPNPSAKALELAKSLPPAMVSVLPVTASEGFALLYA